MPAYFDMHWKVVQIDNLQKEHIFRICIQNYETKRYSASKISAEVSNRDFKKSS